MGFGFLTLNGIDVGALSAEVGEVVIGDKVRAYDGTMRSTVRVWKRQWKVHTGPLVVSDAQALKNLIRGQGDVWSLDADVYSAKGQVISGTAPTITASGKFGSFGNFGSNGQTFPFSSGWSALWWQKSQDDSAWNHYALIGSSYYLNGALLNVSLIAAGGEMPSLAASGSTLVVKTPISAGGGNYSPLATWQASHFYGSSDVVVPSPANGFAYKNNNAPGSSGASQPTWPTTYGATVNDGGTQWICKGPTAARLDDVVILPYAVPTSWLSALAAATAPWGALPRLAAGGTFIGSGTVTVTGEVQDGQINQAVYSTGFGIGQTFDFMLEEV